MEWFSSDQHFFHKNIISYCQRPFSSVEEMNEAMIENWNRLVSKEDTVHVLGDVFFCDFHHAKAIMSRLNGSKTLQIGNHDRFKPAQLAELGFSSFTANNQKRMIANHSVVISHYPYRPSKEEIKRIEEELFLTKGLTRKLKVASSPVNQGGWLLHGHVHEKWQIKEKQINVGVDVWGFSPVSIEQIAEIITLARS